MTPRKGKAVALPHPHLTDTGSALELETRSLVSGKVLTPRKDLSACSSGLQGPWAVRECVSPQSVYIYMILLPILHTQITYSPGRKPCSLSNLGCREISQGWRLWDDLGVPTRPFHLRPSWQLRYKSCCPGPHKQTTHHNI